MSTGTLPAAQAPAVQRRLGLGLGVAAAILLVLSAASLALGAENVPFADVWRSLTEGGTDADVIVRGVRVPRTILAVLVGAALAVAGALMQALSRNPLAEPGLLGVNAGAALGVVIAMAHLGVASLAGYVWFALAGASVATVAVYALGSAGAAGASPARLALAGAAITAALTGVISAIVLLSSTVFNGFRAWSVGTLSGRTAPVVIQVAPFVVAGILLTLFLVSSLNALALGEDAAKGLGANVARTRLLGVVATTLLCGAATAAAGPISFVGLVVPHMVRTFTGPDHRWLLPYCLLAGPILMVAADLAGRLVARPGELPTALVTAAVGAPVFVYLIRRRRMAGL
ncbi:FecCD family ABC transporter permease [Nonomuraea sp. NPDC050790]|uniref:FecCD family ABC transporter permease n=1 Tax=Nonomuraea sp. NPDC050790 TaxID=3364371 RepID=UPI0037B2A03F